MEGEDDMKKSWIRFWAKVLVGVLLFPLFWGFFDVEVKTVNAAVDEKSGLTIVNEETVRTRVLELANKLGINVTSLSQNGDGIYFTKSGTYCVVGSHSGCENCRNKEVIKQTWFIERFGTISNVELFPKHYSAYSEGGTISNNAKACAGFVGFALWYIAKEDNSSSVYRKYLGEKQIQAFTIDNLKKSDIRVGDVIRINKKGEDSGIHSMMFISMNEAAGTIKVLDCNWKTGTDKTAARVRIHDVAMADYANYNMAITRVSNYEPDYGVIYSLPGEMTSASSNEAKANIINYAIGLEGYNRDKFLSAERNDIPSGDWCTWFIKLCGERVGIGNLFSSKTTVSDFCTDMIKNYNAKAYYYSDSTFLTAADKTVLNGATAVTKATFTPQPGDIYILHENGFSGLSQVGLVTKVVDGSIYAVVGNNGSAQEVQRRESTTNYFYKLSNAKCPIVGYIRPDYESFDKESALQMVLSSASEMMEVGDSKTLQITFTPVNIVVNKNVTWQSDNTSVATVSDGTIVAVAPGKAIITAVFNNWSASCEVTVKEEPPKVDTTDKDTATDTTEIVNKVTGWIKDIMGRWFFVNQETGNKEKGWFCDVTSKLWYYLNEDDGYMLSDSWFCDPESGRWYYLDANGAMCTGWINVDGKQYYLDKNGAMCTGWNMLDGIWYLLGGDGAMLTGWQKVGGKYYYMTEDGKCLINTTTPDGYKVDGRGARID